MALRVRDVTEDERAKLERIMRAKTAPVRLAERARIVLAALEGLTVPQVAARVGVSEVTARQWIRRYNAAGLAGLEDAPRSGRPVTYADDAQSRVIAKARSLPPKPAGAEVPPTCHWTLDRLQEELAKDGLPIKRSQIRRLLKAEHVKWQRPRTWLESDDPAFAETRGASSGSTPTRPPTAP
jgi:transposase